MDTPKHIGLIPDGNRRFARRLLLNPEKGHEWGAKKVEALLEWCKELKIKEVTIYAFSMQNFSRPKKEFNYLMNLFEKEFTRMLDDTGIYKDKVKINFIGRINLFPEKIQKIAHKLMDATKNHDNHLVNFAMAYGGRTELVDTIKKLLTKVKEDKLRVDDIDENVILENLYTRSEPELIIRTSGEHRTSDFLLYQSAYSEWVFLEKFWPEFDKADLQSAIKEYNSRERRLGR